MNRVQSRHAWAALLIEQVLVHEPRRDPSQEGCGPEDPVVVPDAGDERRAEGTRGIDAHAAHAALQPHQQRYNESHCQGSQLAPSPAEIVLA